MKSLFCFTILACFVHQVKAQDYVFDWAKQTTGNSSNYATKMIKTIDSNLILVGIVKESVDLDPGPGVEDYTVQGEGYYIQYLDSNGLYLNGGVIRPLSSTLNHMVIYNMKASSQNELYLTGHFRGNYDFDPGPGTSSYNSVEYSGFLIKLNSNGTLAWNRVFHNSQPNVASNIGREIQLFNDSIVLLAGIFKGSIDFDPGNGQIKTSTNNSTNGFVAKYDSAGNYQDFLHLTTKHQSSISSFSIDSDSNLCIAGEFRGTIDLDPGIGVSMHSSTNSNKSGLFFLKLDMDFNFIWATSFEHMVQLGHISKIEIDEQDNWYTTFKFSGVLNISVKGNMQTFTPFGSNNFLILKMNRIGTIEWARQIHGTLNASADIYLSDYNLLYIYGGFLGNADLDIGPNQDIYTSADQTSYILEIDTSGNQLRTNVFAGFDENVLTAMTSIGHSIYINGYFKDSIDVDLGTGSHDLYADDYDGFLLRYSTCPYKISVDSVSSCMPYTWVDGNTYSISQTGFKRVANQNDCDSLYYLVYTLIPSVSSTQSVLSCESYTWIDGNTYTSDNNTATYSFTSPNGCDSTVTLDLKIGQAESTVDKITSCDPYTWIDGNTYTQSNNTATFILQSQYGCDSLVSLDFLIETLSKNVTRINKTLSCDQFGATYQWIDCHTMQIIPGATNQSYNAPDNGSYACIITTIDCIDTTDCFDFASLGFDDLIAIDFKLFPNPNSGTFTVDFGQHIDQGNIRILSMDGKLVKVLNFESKSNLTISFEAEPGVYWFEMSSAYGVQRARIIRR